jgi:hypothetical protein
MDVIGPVTNSGTVSTASGSAVRFFGPVTGAGNFTGPGSVTFLNTFSPGASPAAISFGGGLALASGSSLVMELGGTASGSQYDTLDAGGDVTLGGAIDVDLLGNFVPTIGSVFQVVSTTGNVSGKFSTASLPAVENAAWQLSYGEESVSLRLALAGDFNFDGRVDAADYTVWRNQAGQGGAALAGDGNNDGQVNSSDYTVWKSRFGQTAAGAGSVTPAVPEPLTCWLLLVGAAVLGVRRRR